MRGVSIVDELARLGADIKALRAARQAEQNKTADGGQALTGSPTPAGDNEPTHKEPTHAQC